MGGEEWVARVSCGLRGALWQGSTLFHQQRISRIGFRLSNWFQNQYIGGDHLQSMAASRGLLLLTLFVGAVGNASGSSLSCRERGFADALQCSGCKKMHDLVKDEGACVTTPENLPRWTLPRRTLARTLVRLLST